MSSLIGYGYFLSFLLLSIPIGYFAGKSLTIIKSYRELKSQLIIWKYILLAGSLFALAGLTGGYSIIAGHLELSADHILHYTFILVGYICLLAGIYKYYRHLQLFLTVIKAAEK
jgi:hypothetical protein